MGMGRLDGFGEWCRGCLVDGKVVYRYSVSYLKLLVIRRAGW